jgi:hypothetical protein
VFLSCFPSLVGGFVTDFFLQCFKDSSDHLNVSYSVTPAFG